MLGGHSPDGNSPVGSLIGWQFSGWEFTRWVLTRKEIHLGESSIHLTKKNVPEINILFLAFNHAKECFFNNIQLGY